MPNINMPIAEWRVMRNAFCGIRYRNPRVECSMQLYWRSNQAPGKIGCAGTDLTYLKALPRRVLVTANT